MQSSTSARDDRLPRGAAPRVSAASCGAVGSGPTMSVGSCLSSTLTGLEKSPWVVCEVALSVAGGPVVLRVDAALTVVVNVFERVVHGGLERYARSSS
jgi:hypothetical protein